MNQNCNTLRFPTIINRFVSACCVTLCNSVRVSVYILCVYACACAVAHPGETTAIARRTNLRPRLATFTGKFPFKREENTRSRCPSATAAGLLLPHPSLLLLLFLLPFLPHLADEAFSSDPNEFFTAARTRGRFGSVHISNK